jgi:porphobilinogen synthase
VRSLLEIADKKTYQMAPGNIQEAIREASFDLQEGADMLLIKPGLPYLDVVSQMVDTFNVPILSYQVSGEYVSIKVAAKEGYISERHVFLESCLALKRAGSRAIVTYAALDLAEWLKDVPF